MFPKYILWNRKRLHWWNEIMLNKSTDYYFFIPNFLQVRKTFDLEIGENVLPDWEQSYVLSMNKPRTQEILSTVLLWVCWCE